MLKRDSGTLAGSFGRRTEDYRLEAGQHAAVGVREVIQKMRRAPIAFGALVAF